MPIYPQSLAVLIAIIGWQVGSAQQPDAAVTVGYQQPVESDWEFGMRLTAAGQAQGITGYFPIPMNYPEQEVEVLDEFKSDNVGRTKQINPTDHSTQYQFTIGRLGNGESAEAVQRLRIRKKMIVAPSDPSSLKVPVRVSSKLRPYLKPSPYIESDHQRIEAIAAELADESLKSWDQVETIYRWVRDNIRYEFDVQIHSCLDALDRKQGDCEELSSLFIAICRAQGIPARAVWIPGHTYPEFYLEDQNGNGCWYPCQVAGQYEFGAMTESKPILQKGDRFRMPGQSGYVRYLQPTLKARNSTGNIDIDWISRQVSDGKGISSGR